MSDIVTTDTGRCEPADADTAADETDVLFRDDVDDARRAADARLTAHRHCVDCRVRGARDRGGRASSPASRWRSTTSPQRPGCPRVSPRSPGTARQRRAGAGGGFPGANGATGGFARRERCERTRPAALHGATPAPASNGTTGQIKLVDGSNIYITTSDGSTVKVTTTPTSKVTKSVAGAVGDLKAGDTITVQGAAGSDGTIAASSISQAP